MDSLGLKCERCSETAVMHMTETVDGKVRECHLCEAHAQEAGVAVPRDMPFSWVDDDRHTRLAVTAGQLERPEDTAVRFPDGFEINLRELWDLFTDGDQETILRCPDGSETRVRDWGELLHNRRALLDIPQKRPGEPRQVCLELAPETPKEGS